MRLKQILGTLLPIIGFIITIIEGIWFAARVANGEAFGKIVGDALLAFIPVLFLMSIGLNFYIQSSREDEAESIVRLQRDMLDILREHGEYRIDEMAQKLGVTQETLGDMVHQLVHLQIFSGYVNWNAGMMYATEARQLSDMRACKICGSPLQLVDTRLLKCANCGTEYFFVEV